MSKQFIDFQLNEEDIIEEKEEIIENIPKNPIYRKVEQAYQDIKKKIETKKEKEDLLDGIPIFFQYLIIIFSIFFSVGLVFLTFCYAFIKFF